MKQGIYDFFRIPYYRAWITKDREVIGGGIIRMNKTGSKYFRLKKYRAIFLLPNIKVRPPIKIKSGYLLIYDVRNMFPLKMVTSDEADEIYSKEEYAVKPNEFIPSDLNPEEIHDFLEAKVTEDIMADDKKEFPIWVIYLITVAAAAAIILGAFYLLTHGSPDIIYMNSSASIPTPIPTPGYVVTP